MPTSPLLAGFAMSELALRELWLRCLEIGGSESLPEFDASLRGPDLPAYEYDVIAQVLNDHFIDAGGDHPVAYSDEAEDGDDPGPPSRGDRR